MKTHRYLALMVVGSFLFCSGVLAGTTGKISGTVRDADNGEPLPGANVIIEGTTLGAATNMEGFYFIINVPPGTYSLRATMVGYTPQSKTQVKVSTDVTTKLDFELSTTVVELGCVTVTAERPAIQKDLTSSLQAFGGQEIAEAPVEQLSEMIEIQAGVNQMGSEASGFVSGAPGDGLHIRGGRENETVFLLDGVKVGDDVYGGSRYIQNTSGSTIDEMKTIIGTFNAEYGGKTGGVISVITKDASPKFSGSFSGYTDNFGIDDYDRDTFQGEFSLSGPIPSLKKLSFFVNGQMKSTDGRSDIFGVEIPGWKDSEGRVGRVPDENVPDDWKVPLDWEDKWNGMAKLIYKPTPSLKFTSSYFYSRNKDGKYRHEYRYLPYHMPWVDTENFGVIVKMVHTVSCNTFYELMGSYQKTDFFYGTTKDREKKPLYGDRITYQDYYVSGAVHDYNTDSLSTWQLVGNLTSQVTKNHQIKTGLEVRWLDVFHRMDMAGGSPIQEIDGEIYEVHLSYAGRKPTEIAGYIQDKMEFDELGMIMNAGVRLELWDPNMEYMLDPNLPYTTDMIPTEKKFRISPRFGISYPVSDKAAFHLAYGHFYQLPKYMELLSCLTDEGYYAGRPNLAASQDPGISNPNAEPEKTVSYEAGIQFQLTEEMSMNLTPFYREMGELMGVLWLDGGGGYVYLDNIDFGNAKGIELMVDKRLSGYWSARFNYAWSTAKISTSSPLNAAQKNRFIAYRTFLADWDRPHDISLFLLFSDPQSWGISAITSVRSGRPYTVLAEQLNTERMPWEITTDVRLSKYFNLFGLKETFYIKIDNIFNRRNVRSVYSQTGKWDVDGESERHLTAVPTRISDGRTVRLGFKFSF
ncbi:MAG: TonB-dependent receptor [Gemmatimonadota bacterium]|nr:MAG: TonB-dependent receptor [Gemmatimonadota bacterium]